MGAAAMPTPQHMREVVERYIAALNAADIDAIVALYASDALVEDPVGSEPQRGHDAIRAFYARSLSMKLEVALQGEVRAVAGEAAFAFTVALQQGDQRMVIAPIDHFRFDAEGRITHMRAFFGPDNMRTQA